MTSKSRFAIDISESAVQHIPPPSDGYGLGHRFEGVAISPSGNTLAVATINTNSVFLFRREADGRFASAPYWSFGGPEAPFSAPHDVSFGLSGETELLAVAQRVGVVTVYEKRPASENYDPLPIVEISGQQSKLSFPEGVAFVPPDDDYLAVCDLKTNSVFFYPRLSQSPIVFGTEPTIEFQHASLSEPDGVAFTPCGRWLAVTNHGNHTVSIFRRRKRLLSGFRLRYGPEPVTIIKDPGMRRPHSVAFCPETGHLVVTNAASNHFCVYEPRRQLFNTRWADLPVVQATFGSESRFKEVNALLEREGGPKGVATHKNTIAIVSHDMGLKIYSSCNR